MTVNIANCNARVQFSYNILILRLNWDSVDLSLLPKGHKLYLMFVKRLVYKFAIATQTFYYDSEGVKQYRIESKLCHILNARPSGLKS